jgi:hypothetical protein
MFTIRNMGGAALFLFGTTYLWLTPAFAAQGTSTKGVAWSVTQVAALMTLAGFTVATWGLFTKAGWWEPTAIAFAAIGAIVLIPYWLAARNTVGTTFNVFVHVLGIAGVLLLLLVPVLERWVSGHVTAGH